MAKNTAFREFQDSTVSKLIISSLNVVKEQIVDKIYLLLVVYFQHYVLDCRYHHNNKG